MVGKYLIEIATKKVRYRLEVKRKYTLITGKSASGKTYLTHLVDELKNCEFICDVPVGHIHLYDKIAERLSNDNYKIFLIDEDVPISHYDADLMHKSDCYFVIITRRALSQIPIAIAEVYDIESTTSRFGDLNKLFTENQFRNRFLDGYNEIKPDLVITEDSNSGYEFMKNILKGVVVESAGGNTKIEEKLSRMDGLYKNIVIFLDGACFGNYMLSLFNYLYICESNIVVFAPESFEYLLLNTSAVNADKRVLKETYNYHDKAWLDSRFSGNNIKYNINSWERFYTAYLTLLSGGRYSKSHLNNYYMIYSSEVLSQLEGLKK